MKTGTTRTTSQSESLVPWLIRRMMPGVVIGAVVAAALVLLKNHSPASLRILAIVASAVFGLFSIVYFYWASCATNSGGYRWSRLERLGLVSSGFGAFLMFSKLGFPKQIPGPTIAYFFGALLLAFVVRPMLDCAGSKKTNSEQDVHGNPH